MKNMPLNKSLPQLTRRVLNSYRKRTRISRIGETCMPSRARICEVLDQIQQLLFPGYYGHKQLTDENLQYHVGNLLMTTGRALAEQIFNCLCASRGCDKCVGSVKCEHEAQSMACELLEQIPTIRSSLSLDAQAFYDGDPAAKNIDEVIYCYPGYYAIMVYRVAHALLQLQVPLMPRIMTERAHSLTGADIHPGAVIGKSFFIDHATGVVIGETTEIGANVKIYQGVTLGARSFPKDERGRVIKGYKRHPTIQDNVTIYPNATILGGKTIIGKGATIGGNVYITESVAANCLVKQESPNLQVLKKPAKKKVKK